MQTRLLGLLVMAMGLASGTWLYRLVHSLPYRQEGAQHLALGAFAVLALSAGASLLVFGPKLFSEADPDHH